MTDEKKFSDILNLDTKSFMDRLRHELDKDSKINLGNLTHDIVMSSKLQAKWLNYYSKFKELYIKHAKELKELNTATFLKVISGKGGYSVTQREAKYIVSGDKHIVDLEEKIEKIEMAMDFFLDAQKIIRDKSFAISNIIQLREYEAGIS